MCLLHVIQEICPISKYEWAIVVYEYKRTFSEKNRGIEILRRKLRALKITKTPNGEPFCLEEVRLAKNIMREITEKVEIQGGDDDDEDADNSTIYIFTW